VIAAGYSLDGSDRARQTAESFRAFIEELAGELRTRALRLVHEWAEIHRAELEANWARAEAHLPLDTIEPLP
jgi:hypothetical protein